MHIQNLKLEMYKELLKAEGSLKTALKYGNENVQKLQHRIETLKGWIDNTPALSNFWLDVERNCADALKADPQIQAIHVKLGEAHANAYFLRLNEKPRELFIQNNHQP